MPYHVLFKQKFWNLNSYERDSRKTGTRSVATRNRSFGAFFSGREIFIFLPVPIGGGLGVVKKFDASKLRMTGAPTNSNVYPPEPVGTFSGPDFFLIIFFGQVFYL